MKPNPRFQSLPGHFWANVRTISQEVGYTVRGEKIVRVPTIEEMVRALDRVGLDTAHLMQTATRPSALGKKLLSYYAYRAQALNEYVEPRLMDVSRARREFERLKARLHPTCPLPMNKQKKEKKAPAYFTCIINMLIEANAQGYPCDHDPRRLTTVTKDNAPLRTLARRVDGAFPTTVNPVAIWEIKEYYYTTTFGSRIADGVYETLMDGMELRELREQEDVHVKHYFMVDAHYTWWECGKSYLCRLVDMLHMGLVDEVLFGYEVIEELPRIVKSWKRLVRPDGSRKLK